MTVNCSPDVVPAAFGIPVMAPVPGFNVAQSGSVPAASVQL